MSTDRAHAELIVKDVNDILGQYPDARRRDRVVNYATDDLLLTLETHTGQRITLKEARFIKYLVLTGDIDVAVKKAGYKNTAVIKKDYILEELKYQMDLYNTSLVADREEILRYYTSVMRGELKDQFGLDAPLSERTKAANELKKILIDTPAKMAALSSMKDVVFNLNWDTENQAKTVRELEEAGTLHEALHQNEEVIDGEYVEVSD